MKGMKYSLCVHAVLLSLLAVRGCAGGAGMGADGHKDQQQGAENDKGEPGKIDQNQVVEVDIIPPPKKGPELGAAEDGVGPPAHVGDNCDHFFGGIGITQSYGARNPPADMSHVIFVNEVHHGYPAEKAGIKELDEILNSGEIRGEIGTKVLVKTIRDGKRIDYTIVRDKICTSPPKGKGEGP